MRTLMIVTLPVEPFNALVRNGTAGPTMKKILDDMKPEAAYFSELDGERSGIIVVDVAKASDIPRLAEPWFLKFGANVKFRMAMTPEDLGHSDLDSLGKKWG
jgi:hypothetical protein